MHFPYSDVARSLGVSQPTARDDFRIAGGTFLWCHLPAYERDAVKRVVKHPKGYLRDSGLPHFLLRLQDQGQLRAHPGMGASGEGMVVETVLRGLNAQGTAFQAYHYRTGAGAEVDMVLEGEFGLVPIEIKYTQHVDSRSLRAIRDFVAERGCLYGIVLNNDERPRMLDEKLVGVPVGCLQGGLRAIPPRKAEQHSAFRWTASAANWAGHPPQVLFRLPDHLRRTGRC